MEGTDNLLCITTQSNVVNRRYSLEYILEINECEYSFLCVESKRATGEFLDVRIEVCMYGHIISVSFQY